MAKIIEQNKNIDLWQDNVNELVIENGKVSGVRTACRQNSGQKL